MKWPTHIFDGLFNPLGGSAGHPQPLPCVILNFLLPVFVPLFYPLGLSKLVSGLDTIRLTGKMSSHSVQTSNFEDWTSNRMMSWAPAARIQTSGHLYTESTKFLGENQKRQKFFVRFEKFSNIIMIINSQHFRISFDVP